MEKLTVRELRAILYEVGNQDLTVSELRRKLYEEKDQDELLNNRKYRLNKY